MSIFPYDQHNDSKWLNQLNNENNVDNTIDHFFTQRKVTEYEEIIDEKTLERKKKKHTCIYNFIAINIPTCKTQSNLIIDIEIWGDEKFNFKGIITKQEGDVPHLMLKLKEDKMLFLKLIFRDSDKIIKTFISFIPIIKRYQLIPDINIDV